MIKNIDAHELKQMMKIDKYIQLIDVRENYEFNDEHIDGAKLIPLGQLQARINEIDKDKKAVMICRSGARSSYAAQFLVQKGYKHIYNLSGGMMMWD